MESSKTRQQINQFKEFTNEQSEQVARQLIDQAQGDLNMAIAMYMSISQQPQITDQKM